MKKLLQVIVNTKGLSRTVVQERDSLGRFVSGAQVSRLDNPVNNVTILTSLEKELGESVGVVFVQHSYCTNSQFVSSVNRNTKKGNAVSFINDGISTKRHMSIYN